VVLQRGEHAIQLADAQLVEHDLDTKGIVDLLRLPGNEPIDAVASRQSQEGLTRIPVGQGGGPEENGAKTSNGVRGEFYL
jgi:hypothetical protein